MGMNPEVIRRTVLKGICATFALSVIPISIKSVQAEVSRVFDPRVEYGRAIEIGTLNLKNGDTKMCLWRLLRTVKKVLPKGTPFEIIASIGHYGVRNAIAWYYSPSMERTQFRNVVWKYDSSRRIFVLGRFIAT